MNAGVVVEGPVAIDRAAPGAQLHARRAPGLAKRKAAAKLGSVARADGIRGGTGARRPGRRRARARGNGLPTARPARLRPPSTRGRVSNTGSAHERGFLAAEVPGRSRFRLKRFTVLTRLPRRRPAARGGQQRAGECSMPRESCFGRHSELLTFVCQSVRSRAQSTQGVYRQRGELLFGFLVEDSS